MKTKMSLIGILIILLVVIGCNENPPNNPGEPIFSEVIIIELRGPTHQGSVNESDGSLDYDLPPEVEHAIVELFNGPIIPNNDNKTVSTENLVGGIRDGMEQFSRSSIEVQWLLFAESDGSDFIPGSYLADKAAPETYHWIVLGYDANGILTHASPEWEVTINWN